MTCTAWLTQISGALGTLPRSEWVSASQNHLSFLLLKLLLKSFTHLHSCHKSFLGVGLRSDTLLRALSSGVHISSLSHSGTCSVSPVFLLWAINSSKIQCRHYVALASGYIFRRQKSCYPLSPDGYCQSLTTLGRPQALQVTLENYYKEKLS